MKEHREHDEPEDHESEPTSFTGHSAPRVQAIRKNQGTFGVAE